MARTERRWYMQRIQRIKGFSANSQGFTIVELTLVIVFMAVLIPIFSYLLVNTYQDSLYLNDQIKTTTQTAQALSLIEDDVRNAASFESVKPAQYSDFYGPRSAGSSGVEAWNYIGYSNSNMVLMTQNYATNVNGLSNDRKPLFIKPVNFSCQSTEEVLNRLKYLTIYFIYNNTLYRRLLTDSRICPGDTPIQKQTCPPYIADSSKDASCQANDEVLLENVTGFSTKYFQISADGTSQTIESTFSPSNPPPPDMVLAGANYVEVTITTSTPGGGESSTMMRRIAKANS